MINDILVAIYFNFVPITVMVFGSLIFVQFVKYEHKRRNNG